MHETDLLDLTGIGRPSISQQLCGAAWSSRWLTVLLTNRQHTCELVFKPEVDVLNIRCDCQFVFAVLDELYASHHAWCSSCVLRVHYRVWNVMFYFHKVAYVQYLGEVGIFHTWVKKFLPLYNSAKIIKIDQDFPKLWSQMYCHLFMVHSVHEKSEDAELT